MLCKIRASQWFYERQCIHFWAQNHLILLRAFCRLRSVNSVGKYDTCVNPTNSTLFLSDAVYSNGSQKWLGKCSTQCCQMDGQCHHCHTNCEMYSYVYRLSKSLHSMRTLFCCCCSSVVFIENAIKCMCACTLWAMAIVLYYMV